MKEVMSCSCCEMQREVELIEREEWCVFHGKEVHYMARFYRCTYCGEEFELPGMLDKNLEAAREAYLKLV